MTSNSTSDALAARAMGHIQGSEGVLYTISYWGYAVRNMPCTNDAGSCAYLDAVYGNHQTGVIFTFILWAVLGAVLLVLTFSRLLKPGKNHERGARQSFMYRLSRSISAAYRRYLLPESLSSIFGYSTRLQLLVLAILCAYLAVFTFVGITYKTWKTPVKGTDLYNTRSGLGSFADRVGAFAFALTPFTIALCSRDSLLSLMTGIPYQSFNFLHRWTGYIMLIQSFVHTISWTIIEGKLYQPQPIVYKEWIKQPYMIWGIVAQSFLTFLVVFSWGPVIRRTGYEFFRKSHLIAAGLYIGACWGHWEQLKCWMIASLVLLGIDLVARTVRSCLIHCGFKNGSGSFGFHSIPTKMETFHDPTGTIVRMTFTHEHAAWTIGQHFYLTFPALSIWQSHPFTPSSVPNTESNTQQHTYIIRAYDGETRKLANLAEAAAKCYPRTEATTPVIMMGPHGGSTMNRDITNMLCISGGTGVTFTIPAIIAALSPDSPVRNIELIWTVRHVENLAWLRPELAYLLSHLAPLANTGSLDKHFKDPIMTLQGPKRFRIRIYVTRPRPRTAATATTTTALYPSTKETFQSDDKELCPTTTISSFDSADDNEKDSVADLIPTHPDFFLTYLESGRPSVRAAVDAFLDNTVEYGRSQVIGSGPAALGTQIREAVAVRNAPGRVWRGDEEGDVECVWDDRMG
jgi:predicted ferric reductase